MKGFGSRNNNLGFIYFLFSLLLLVSLIFPFNKGQSAGNLSVEIISAYNLVVDSNVLSPSSYMPEVATVIGKFCNSGDTSITNVYGYIGDFTHGTPGVYPVETNPIRDTLTYKGDYSFTHLGGASDASRRVGDLDPGECKYQYWSFQYPKTAINNADDATIAAWGVSVKPDDDLSLDFDVWGTADGSLSNNVTQTMYFRNEISSMANKIKPNGNPGGQWFNTDTDTVYPGDTITTNGIMYRLGNVNQGFDNNGDFVPDYNAWLQPFGSPAYDPSCFRLISTKGTLTVTRGGGNPDMVIDFEDQLYFTDLPADNTNVTGEVYYEFLALGGVCTIPITPYQEAASGRDNEKFNGDYGTGIDPLGSYDPEVTISKSGPGTTSEGGSAYTYTIPFTNTSTTVEAGLTLSSGASVDAPLVISDTVPVGLEYIANSAASGNTIPTGNSVTIHYSTDGGQTWSLTDPGTTASTVGSEVMLQWWLGEPLEVSGSSNNSGQVTFQAQVPSGYISGGGDPFIENCAEGSFGDAASFGEDCATTIVSGTNSIGDLVWADDGGTTGISNNGIYDGDEAGIDNIAVTLYWDKNGDGVLDDDDLLVETQDTAGGGGYDFTSLPDGDYIVVVDTTDTQLPTGYGPTTPKQYAVSVSGSQDYNDADFGFGPSLSLTKILTSDDPAYEGGDVTFRIDLTNNLPGDGTADGFCQHTVWATAAGTNDDASWSNLSGAYGIPDGAYAFHTPSTNLDDLTGSSFSLGTQAGNITKVEAIYSMYVDGSFTDDHLDTNIWHSAAKSSVTDISVADINAYGPEIGNQGIYAWDVTSLATWSWSDFTGTTLEIGFAMQKTQPTDNAILYIDAMGFRITTDQHCGGADTTIAVLPLTDTYDSTYLTFVSADPVETSQSAGTITWADLGPLYAGQTKSVEVTFTALDPSSQSAVNTINTASVTEAKFSNGNDVNDDSDTADVDIEPAGSISGYAYSDSNSDGWQGTTGYESLGTTDFGIPGATATLYACYKDGTILNTGINTNKACSGGGSNNGTWTSVGTITTDSNGYYEFTGLEMGFYYVALSGAGGTQNAEVGASETDQNPNGTSPTGHSCGTCGSQWGDTSQNLNESYFNPIGTLSGSDLASGNEDITDVSFGYTGVPATVFGTVWTDSNGDGDQDTGEDGINGVTVSLCSDVTCSGTVHATVSTDADGNYSFDLTALGLEDTDVYVVVTQPADTTQTGDPDESGTCSTSCDDATTTALNVSAGDSSGSHDFGYQPSGTYSIGDTLYVDWNGDGDQDTGEEGIADITIWLYEDDDGDGIIDPEDALIETDSTDSNGEYSFDNLPNGSYIVVVNTSDTDFPSNHDETQDPDESGVCSTCDSKASVTLAGSGDDTIDFGYLPCGLGSIGDYLWIDTDGDGQQDVDEDGIGLVSLNLYQDQDGDGVIDTEDALVDTTITLDYEVIDGYLDVNGDDTTAGDTADDAADLLGYDIIDGLVDINDDGSITTADDGTWFGYTVLDGYIDIDGDTATGSDAGDDADLYGLYDFTNLPAGDYIVEIAQSEFGNGGDLEGYTLTSTGSSYTNTFAQISYEVTLTAGEDFDEADFGFAKSSIGDLIWQDNNGNGLYDAGEPGLNGVLVNLYEDVNNNGVYDSITDTLITSTTTANNSEGYPGYYLFDGVLPGNYIVEVAASNFSSGGSLENYTLTGDPDSYNDTNPANLACTAAGATNCDNRKFFDRWDSASSNDLNPAIPAGTQDLSADFGYQPPNAIGDYVWLDFNGDGVQDPEETGISDVTITLTPPAGVDLGAGVGTAITTTTDTDGYYSFGNLPNGTGYTIAAAQPSGTTQTYDADGTGTANTATFDVTGLAVTNLGTCTSDCDLKADFGYQLNGSNGVSGTIFYDADQSHNIYNFGGANTDAPFAGITLYLWDSNGTPLGTTLTDSNGLYSFTNLPDDTYTVSLNPDSPLFASLSQSSEPDETDCVANPSSCNNYFSVTLSGGTTSTDNDFGFLGQSDLGDLPDNIGGSPNYATYYSPGPSHIVFPDSGSDGPDTTDNVIAVWAGATVDVETNGQPDANATGDGTDEDGLAFASTGYTAGDSQDVTITLNSSEPTTVYYGLWIDWGQDGTFEDFYNGSGATSSPVDVTQAINVPTDYGNNDELVYFRLRVSDSALTSSDYNGTIVNGEVEDYVNGFGPTAVKLSSFEAHSPKALSTIALLLMTGGIGMLVIGIVFFRRRFANTK